MEPQTGPEASPSAMVTHFFWTTTWKYAPFMNDAMATCIPAGTLFIITLGCFSLPTTLRVPALLDDPASPFEMPKYGRPMWSVLRRTHQGGLPLAREASLLLPKKVHGRCVRSLALDFPIAFLSLLVDLDSRLGGVHS